MPKKIDPELKAKAKELFEQGYTLVEIAKEIEVGKSSVGRWKKQDEVNGIKWEIKHKKKRNLEKNPNKDKNPKKKSRNSLSNLKKAPNFSKGNKVAITHGIYSDKTNDPEFIKLFNEGLEIDPLQTRREQISSSRANLILGQRGVDYNDVNTIRAITLASRNLSSVIKDYQSELESEINEEILKGQKLDNELKELELEQKKKFLEGEVKDAYKGIPADMIAPVFSGAFFDCIEHKYKEMAFPGGRGSGKSSVLGLIVVHLIKKNPDFNALILRRVSATLRDSVYNQITWAIDVLGLRDEFSFTKNPLEITYIPTGQKIYFRGTDKEEKIKGIKPETGYIAITWFEELDQFKGEEAIRSIRQSTQRGGEVFYEFLSFNPPKQKNNWANIYIEENRKKKDFNVYRSTYLDMPVRWLGEDFFKEAEFLKEKKPSAYENEYLGIANGSGGNVFENLVIREITDEEINGFDNIVNGIDWGYIHPSAFVRANYDPNRMSVVVFDEEGGSRLSNEKFCQMIKTHGLKRQDLIVCDSSEPKSISRFNELGLYAVKAKKGPSSREFGYKWLDSQIEIVIDPKRTPNLYKEAVNLEYERDSNGNLTGFIPKINDDYIDALRYATEAFQNPVYDPFS